MQGPGGWVRLGFVLNWKCLVSGVEAKPCIGHWDSCALPGGEQGVLARDLDLQPWGAGSCWQPGCHELGLARSKGQERAVLCISPQARGPELLHRGRQRTPLFLVKSFHSFLPLPSLLPRLQLRPWRSWGRNRNAKESIGQYGVRGIIQEWGELDHSPGSQVLLLGVKRSLEIELNRTCFEFSAVWSHSLLWACCR